MNLEEVKQKIEATNTQSEKLNKERQINIGKKETYTTQLNKALSDYKKAYGVELTVENLTAELERVKAEKEKELALVEGMIACINNGDYNGARQLAGEPVVEEAKLSLDTEDAIMPALVEETVTVPTPVVEVEATVENVEESKPTKKRGRPKKDKAVDEEVAMPIPTESVVVPTPVAIPTAEIPTPEVAPTPMAVEVPTPAPVAPTPVAPTPVAPTPVASAPVAPTPVAPMPVASSPVAPTPVAPTPVASAPVAPTPVAPTPVAPTPVVSTPVAPTPVAPTPVAPTPLANMPTPITPAPINTGEIPMPSPVTPAPGGMLNGALEGFAPIGGGAPTPPTDFQSILGGSAFNMN